MPVTGYCKFDTHQMTGATQLQIYEGKIYVS